MSSWLELRSWHEVHAIDVFPWGDWIVHVEQCLPIPVYDLLRILDVSAVYDMAVHAMHWPGSGELRPVRVPRQLLDALSGIGMHQHRQKMYMARALYAHCSQYTIGVARIQDPPRDHMDAIPLMPYESFTALAHATRTPLPAIALVHWLNRVIRHGSTHPLQLRNRHTHCQAPCGRRGRKYSPAIERRVIADEVQCATDHALAGITALAPQYVPRLSCHVYMVALGFVNLVLYAQPLAPCDE